MYNDRPGMLREAGLRNALFDLLEEAIPGGGEPVNLPDEEVIKTISDMIRGTREKLEKEDHHKVNRDFTQAVEKAVTFDKAVGEKIEDIYKVVAAEPVDGKENKPSMLNEGTLRNWINKLYKQAGGTETATSDELKIQWIFEALNDKDVSTAELDTQRDITMLEEALSNIYHAIYGNETMFEDHPGYTASTIKEVTGELCHSIGTLREQNKAMGKRLKVDHEEKTQLEEELEEVRANFAQCLAMEKQAELWADKAAHYKITLGCAEKALRNLPRHTVTSIIIGSDAAFISGIAVGIADFIKGEMKK